MELGLNEVVDYSSLRQTARKILEGLCVFSSQKEQTLSADILVSEIRLWLFFFSRNMSSV